MRSTYYPQPRAGALGVILLGLCLVSTSRDANAEGTLTQTTYRVTYNGASASDFDELFKGDDATPAGQIPKGAQKIQTQIEAEWTETRTAVDSGATLVHYRLGSPEIMITVNGQPALEYIKQLHKGLAAPIAGWTTKDGQIDKVYFGPGSRQSNNAVWSLLLGYRQFASDPEGVAIVEGEEYDANGRYRARYLPAAALGLWLPPGMTLVGKQKIEYLPEPYKWIPGERSSDKLIKTDHMELWLFGGGELQAMEARGETFISVAGKAVAFAEGVCRVQRVRSKVLSEKMSAATAKEAASRLKNGPESRLWSPDISDEHRAKMHHQKLKGRTLKQLVKALLAADKDDRERRAKRTPLYMAFQALAYLYPEEVKQLKPVVRRLETDSMPFRVILAALAQIGNAESQAFMRDLARWKKKDQETLLYVISSLSAVRHPTPESTAFLFKYARTSKDSLVRHASELGLGTMALMLRSDAPQRAREINDWIVGKLNETGTPERQEDLLRAVGNSGSLESLNALRRFLEHKERRLRQLAVAALRWNPTERAEEILLSVMENEPEEVVRKAAMDAFQIRPMTIAAQSVHQRVAEKDEVPELRLGALNNLLRLRFRHPDVLDFIRARGAKDNDKKVREKIEELLSGTD